MNIEQILQERIVGIVGGENSGKTNVLFHFIEECKQYDTAIWCYFFHGHYRQIIEDVNIFSTLEDLETIENSFIFIDEFAELFQLSNRHMRQVVERVFNMVVHNNNVVVLCGVPSYYKQFVAARIHKWIVKSIKFKDCVNGSELKEYVKMLSGDFVGATRIHLQKNEALVSGLVHEIPYIKKYDKKQDNKPLFVLKND